MAFLFNGTNQYLRANSYPTLSKPFTLSARFRVSALNRFSEIITMSSATGTSSAVHVRATNTNTVVAREFTGAGAEASIGGLLSANVWNSVVGGFGSATSRKIFFGGSSATNATSQNAVSNNTLCIGALYFNNNASSWLVGDIAEAAIWSAELTDDEINSINKGFKPHRVRPQSLVFYAPMIREASDIRDAVALTNNNGATVSDHPRVY